MDRCVEGWCRTDSCRLPQMCTAVSIPKSTQMSFEMDVKFWKTSRSVPLSLNPKYLFVALGLAFVSELFLRVGVGYYFCLFVGMTLCCLCYLCSSSQEILKLVKVRGDTSWRLLKLACTILDVYGWVCCFSTLLQKVLLQVLRFSPLTKNQHLIWWSYFVVSFDMLCPPGIS